MDLYNGLKKKINEKTKPPGSLGILEDIALQTGMVLQTITPVLLILNTINLWPNIYYF